MLVPEGSSSCNEEASFIQLPDSVMFDSVSIPHTEGEVIPPALTVSDEVSTMLILCKQKLLLSFNTLDFTKIPPLIKMSLTCA